MPEHRRCSAPAAIRRTTPAVAAEVCGAQIRDERVSVAADGSTVRRWALCEGVQFKHPRTSRAPVSGTNRGKIPPEETKSKVTTDQPTQNNATDMQIDFTEVRYQVSPSHTHTLTRKKS